MSLTNPIPNIDSLSQSRRCYCTDISGALLVSPGPFPQGAIPEFSDSTNKDRKSKNPYKQHNISKGSKISMMGYRKLLH